MKELNFLNNYHNTTKRDYIGRVTEADKALCAERAAQWGFDYWDGDRHFGYGGYHYDGRWLPIAKKIAKHYKLQPGDRILDVGCGKAFLLFEFQNVLKQPHLFGLDISIYGLEHAKPEIKHNLILGNANKLPWPDDYFDFVYSINTFHNLKISPLKEAIQEMERVGKKKKWICVESYRNEREKVNLLYWQLTCNSFFSVDEWQWLYKEWGYSGDYGFIFFE